MFLSLQRKNGLIGTLSEGGEFPLHFAAKVKDSVLAERLITVNCESIEFLNRKLILNPLIKQLDPTLSRYEGMRPLQIAACESKDFKIFQMILATGKVDPNLPIYQSYNPRKEKRSQLKLLEVIFEIYESSMEVFALAIAKLQPETFKSSRSWAYASCYYGIESLIKYYDYLGFDMNTIFKGIEKTPLQVTLDKNQIKAAAILIEMESVKILEEKAENESIRTIITKGHIQGFLHLLDLILKRHPEIQVTYSFDAKAGIYYKASIADYALELDQVPVVDYLISKNLFPEHLKALILGNPKYNRLKIYQYLNGNLKPQLYQIVNNALVPLRN